MTAPAHAIVEAHVSAKARSTFRAKYDPELQMTRFELHGPLGLSCLIRTDQLAALIEQLEASLEEAKADPYAVGNRLLESRPMFEANPRLDHVLEWAS